MSPRHIRWVPAAVVVAITVSGLVLMALYRPLPLGIGVFILGLALLYPATRSRRRSQVASGRSAAE